MSNLNKYVKIHQIRPACKIIVIFIDRLRKIIMPRRANGLTNIIYSGLAEK